MYKETYCTEESYMRIELIAENARVICDTGVALENVIYAPCLSGSCQGRWQAQLQFSKIFPYMEILEFCIYFYIILLYKIFFHAHTRKHFYLYGTFYFVVEL